MVVWEWTKEPISRAKDANQQTKATLPQSLQGNLSLDFLSELYLEHENEVGLEHKKKKSQNGCWYYVDEA